mgnify:CR=1 FL=1
MEKLGHNDGKQVGSFKEFIVPSINELILYSTISITFLLVFNYSIIWSFLNNFSGISIIESNEAISTQFNDFYQFNFASDFFAKVAVFVFWGMVGSVTYMLVWALWHFILRLREDVEEGERAKNKSTFWQSTFAKHTIVFISTLAGILYVMIAFYLFPTVMSLSRMTLYHINDTGYYAYFLSALLIIVVYMYIFPRLWQTIKYIYEIYFAGLDD